MINEQLLQYIKKQREAGTADEKIKENLQAAGWKEVDIEEGFDAVSGDGNSPESHQQMRQQAREQQSSQDSSQTSDAGSKQRGQANQQTAQQKRDESTQENQQNEQQKSRKQTSQAENKDTQPESVSETDKQTADTTNSGQSTANEQPTPLRTMEKDRQRAQAQGQQQVSETNDQAQESEQTEAGQVNLSDPQDDSRTKQKMSKAELESQKKKQSANKNREKQKKAQDQQAATEQFEQNNKQQQQSERRSRKPETQQAKKQQQTRKKKKASKKRKQQNPAKAKQQPQQAKKSRQAKKRKQSRIQQARQQSSSSSIATIILSILGLLLVGGGAAYAYVTYFQGPSASTNAEAVLQSLADSESFQYRIGINGQTESSNDGTVIEGEVDMDPNTQAQTYYTIRDSDQEGGSPVAGLASEFSQYPSLDPRKQQAIQKSIDNQQFMQIGEFQTTQKLGATDNSSGFKTQRFGVSVDPSRLFSVYSTIHEEVYGESVDSQLASTLQNNLRNFTPEQGQIWVHPTSSVPYQLTVIGSNPDGENLQLNMQFKNYGQEITNVSDTYESRSLADGLSNYFDDAANDSGSDIATTSPSNNDGSSSDGAESTTTTTTATSSEETNTEAEMQMMRRQDQVRINDVQQIVIATRVYAKNNGNVPTSLSKLAGGEVLSTVPRDPQTGGSYQYVVTPSGRFHVGATLRATSESQLRTDDNYNSTGSASDGFDGAGSSCASTGNQEGSTCYDKSGTVSSESSTQ